MNLIRVLLLLFCFSLADLTDPPCVVELECRECVPDNAPLVTSHRAANGTVAAAAGDELVLACAGGRFLAYPLLDTVRAVCEAGRFRVRHDARLLHLLELGCQENIFEDVLHQVEGCGPPLQGRAYRMHEPGRNVLRHIATVCFDEDRATAVRLHMSSAAGNRLAMPQHSDESAPLSILGNFNHMFDAKTRHDADTLYSDDVRMNRRVHEAFKHDRYSFAGQTLTSAELLSGHYFDDQNMRVSDFVSNRVAVWRSVAEGNLRHVQRDVAAALHARDAAAALHARDAAAALHARDAPAALHARDAPAALHARDAPAALHARDAPAALHARDAPAALHARDAPAALHARDAPAALHARDAAAALHARDAPAALHARDALDVYAGTHGTLSLRAGRARSDLFLKAGGRFPVPRYVWTVLHARASGKAVALIVLNDPFVAVSEIRDAVFCESVCGRLAWLRELRRSRNYEVPVYGLVFCCHLEHLVAAVPEMPRALVNVTAGNDGLLTDLF